MSEQEELEEYKRQLADVEAKLAKSPNDADLQSLKQELEEIIDLTKGLIAEQQTTEKKRPPPPPPPPPSSSSASGAPVSDDRRVGISQAAKRYVTSEVSELSGWRVGDRCRTVYLNDGQKYPAVISSLKPETKSAVVTFVKYLNQQDTPIVFLERVAAEEGAAANAGSNTGVNAGAASGNVGKGDASKKAVVIKATDAPEVVERKKRLLKKQKREEKREEKDKATAAKVSSWQSFQSASASRPPTSTAAALVAASKSKNSAGGAGAPEAAKGVRTRWDKGQAHEED